MPGILEHLVKRLLHQLPDTIAVRTNDHRATDRRMLRQLGPSYDLVVPCTKIFGTLRQFIVGHYGMYIISERLLIVMKRKMFVGRPNLCGRPCGGRADYIPIWACLTH